MKLTLAQALVYKKRVVEALAKASEDIKTYNSVEAFVEPATSIGGEPTVVANREGVDVKTLVARRTQLKQALISLKLALWDASAGIRQDILALAEMKDDASFWGGVETKHGKSKDRYDTTVQYRDAIFKKADVETTLSQIKKLIDATQTKIEQFNHATYIEVVDLGI